MKLEHYLVPYTEIKLQLIKDLNVRLESVKLLEKNIGRTLTDINQSKILYDPPPRVIEIKQKYTSETSSNLKAFSKQRKL